MYIYFSLHLFLLYIECILDEAADTGLKSCTLGSQAASGNIDLKFTAAKQGVIIALVPTPNYSKVKITCSEITDGVKAFTVSQHGMLFPVYSYFILFYRLVYEFIVVHYTV